MNKYNINGHTVLVNDNADKGFQYLKYDLQPNESEVFFREAKRMGKADFENDQDVNYTLTHNPNATYTISRRS